MSVRRLLAAAILLVACGEEEPVVSIPDFLSRSEVVLCESMGVDTAGLVAVGNLRPVSDTSFLVVDPVSRTVLEMDLNGRVPWKLEFPEEGPGSVADLMDAAASGDSLVVVADGGRNRLVGVSRGGEPRWTFDLRFPVQSVAIAGSRLLVAAVGMDPRIPGLLHERRGDRMVPLGVPFISHPDALARSFTNSVTLYGLADGSAFAAHEFVWPRAWRIPPSGSPTEWPVPMPDGTVAGVGYVPAMPIPEDEIDDMVTPVIGFTVDAGAGDVFYLTRSGARRGGYLEKAIVRASADFEYRGSIRLPVNAVKIVYLQGQPDTLIVADYDLGWHRCPAPPRSEPT